MPSTILAGLFLSATIHSGNVNTILCEARKSASGGNSGRSVPSRRARSGSASSPRNNPRRLPSNSRSSARRKAAVVVDEYDDVTDDDEDQFESSDDRSDDDDDDDDEVSDSQGYDQDIGDDYDDDVHVHDDDDEYDDFEEERERPRQRMSHPRSTRRAAPSKVTSNSRSSQSRSRPTKTSTIPSRSSRPSSKSSRSSRPSRASSRRVVAYTNYRRPPSAFSRGLTALRESIPDPQTIKDSAISSISSAKETTTQLSSNLYREVKGLRSSDLEQVFLKATKPDDSPIKNNFVEQLVAGTYHMRGVPDPWDFALRKLWSKMIENDWRTTLKAVYVLHRFGIDGSPEQQQALKTKLKNMRRTKDPKRKAKYFNTKQLLAGYSSPANTAYRAFLARYAHYVLLRVRCFGGLFCEIGENPTPPKKNASRSSKSRKSAPSSSPQKPITSTCLKKEHLDAAKLILKAGLTCKLRQPEECENTAIAMETVMADMIGLTAAVAKALNSALKSKYEEGDILMPDRALIQLWSEFYSQDLLPQTKAMMKSTTPTLDAYDLFLPSRIGTSVSQELLQKGLKFALAPTVAEPKDVKKDGKTGQEEEDEGLENEGGEAEDETEIIDVVEEDTKEEDAMAYRDDATSEVDQEEEIRRVKSSRDVEDVEDYDDEDEYDEYEYDDGEYYDAQFD